MDPAFAAISLGDMRRRWALPKERRQMLLTGNNVAGDAEAKSWITRMALSAGMRGLFTGTEDMAGARLQPIHPAVGTVSSSAS